MKNLVSKLTLAVTTSLLLTTASIPFASADSVSDAAKYAPADIESHWAEQTLKLAVNADLVKGQGANAEGKILVKPDADVTRAEFVTMLVRALNLTDNGQGKTFTDVKATDWYADAVRIATSHNIVEGATNTTFAPNRKVRRDEIAAIVHRAFEDSVPHKQNAASFKDVRNYWATDAIKGVSAQGLVAGYADNTFKPSKTASRAEATTILLRALQSENTNVPSDSSLIDVVKNAETEVNTAVNAHAYTQFGELATKYATGGYAVTNAAFLDSIVQFDAQGYTVHETFSGALNPTVVTKSDKMAQVSLDGVTLSSVITDKESGTPNENKEPVDREYYLKKDASGQWKIYYVVYK